VPRGGDASGILLGPLALMVLLKGKRNGRKLSRVNRFIVLLILFILMAMIIAGCRDEPPLPPPVPPTPPNDNNRGTEPPPSAPGTPPPPTTAPTPEPTSSCTPTPSPAPSDIFKSGYYDWAQAVEHAEKNWKDYTNAVSSDCTSFVSYALSKGELIIKENKWDPALGFGPWVNTTDLFNYLTQDLRFNSILFENRQNEGYKSYTRLRDYDEWENFLSSHQQEILPGDIVFYWDAEIIQGWGHTAIIDKYGQETVYNTKAGSSSATKPLIYEHHGIGYFNDPKTEQQPRSIDDSPNEWIQEVAIVQIRPRK
jgi:hypothetical protein